MVHMLMLLRRLAAAALILVGLATAAAAQGYNGPNHYTPAMTGGGTQLRAVAPGSAGGLYTSQGASADPHFVVPSANIQSILGAADYGAVRALLDLEAGTDFYSKSAADAAFQPLDSDLTTWAGITPGSGVGTALAAGFASNVQSILGAANYAAIRTLLGLVIGTNVEAWDADLDAWALITPGSGVSAAITTGFSSAVQSILDDSSISAIKTTLSLSASDVGLGNVTNNAQLKIASNLSDVASVATSRSNLGLDAGNSPQFTCVEVGNASDTSLCRDSAAVVSVEGVPLFPSLPQNSKSAAYTLVLADAQKHIFHPSADTTARIWTIPANSSVAYPIGTCITFINQHSAGVITIAITTDTMRLAGAGTTGSRTLAADGMATAVKITSTEWIISGNGLT